VALGHRRLAIVDLSAAGHQPMASTDGRYTLVYNGEIYNHLRLRDELANAGHADRGWRGHSDTETLLAAIQAWGLDATLARCAGMFAFALWDRERAVLTLGRDRLGEKPLYYGWQGEGERSVFLFGSELKALRAHPEFSAQIDRSALRMLLRYNYIPAPHCIYKGIAKLMPGTLLEVQYQQRTETVRSYWSLDKLARAGNVAPFEGGDREAADQLEMLAAESVAQQMVADVPLGAFLSGGVDSSLVAALMQKQSARPIKTFAIGFREEGFDEAVHARAVARHLGTDHTELYVGAEDALKVVPSLGGMYDEPLADDSQIPTFLVSQMAKAHVTVVLSGDGGDELFCGYNTYQMVNNLWHRLQPWPVPLRSLVARGVKAVQPSTWNRMADAGRAALPHSFRQANLGDKLHKGANLLASPDSDALYHGLISQWQDLDAVVIGGVETATLHGGDAERMAGLDASERMMLIDQLTYLPDDVLTKVDRASMNVSLETRVPLLDHRLVEFAWRLPIGMKQRDGQRKWILREVLYRHVPRELIERPKQGFSIPIGTWLRGPLRDWAEALLDERRLAQEGYFYPSVVRRQWQEHLSGKRNWQRQLWSVLMFQVWLEHQ
jgi:asparagine synthase (glutamine-hydrolysing)